MLLKLTCYLLVHCYLTLWLPLVTKTEFLLAMLIQYQADKWRELRKSQVGDWKLIQYQILWTNTIKILCQTLRRIAIKILGRKCFKAAERFCLCLNLSMNRSVNKFGNKKPVFKNKIIQKKGIFGFKSVQFIVQFELEFQVWVTHGKQLV